jgi:hypothetical protein
MDSTANLTERQAWDEIERLRAAHSLSSTQTPAGVLLEHATAGALSLSLWDLRDDLAELKAWLRQAGIETA